MNRFQVLVLFVGLVWVQQGAAQSVATWPHAELPPLAIVPTLNPTIPDFTTSQLESLDQSKAIGADMVVLYCGVEQFVFDACGMATYLAVAEQKDLTIALEVETPTAGAIPDAHLTDQMKLCSDLSFDGSSDGECFKKAYKQNVSDGLDWMVANIPASQLSRLTYLFFGNEVDLYFLNHPAEIVPFAKHLGELVTLTNSKLPGTKSGTVVTFHSALMNGLLNIVHDHLGPVSNAIGVTYYNEMMPGGMDIPATGKHLDAILARYGTGHWEVGITETGVSANRVFGGNPASQVAAIDPYFNWLKLNPKAFAFASLYFAVYPVDFSIFGGFPRTIINWINGLALYDYNPVTQTLTPHAVIDEIKKHTNP